MSKPRTRPVKSMLRRRRVARPLGIELLEERQLLATIIVNTDVDENSAANATISLREAIELTNGSLAVGSLSVAAQSLVSGTPGGVAQDTVLFGIAGGGLRTIQVTSALPAITHPLFIDGYSQAGSVPNAKDNIQVDTAQLAIRLDGSLVAAVANGLTINAPNSVVAGLEITNFTGHGIEISGNNSQGNFLYGNFIGVTARPVTGRDFLPGLGNAGSGIFITSSNNRVGGNNPGLRNVIVDNGVGVQFTGAGGTGNLLQNNFILQNVAQGVLVSSSNNTIGEALQGGGNVISGNGAQGIMVTGGSNIQGNVIVGNEIGTDLGVGIGSGTRPRGLDPLPNGLQGILIQDSPNNTIGSLIPDGKNVIGANEADGILVQGSAATGNRILNNWIGFNIANNLESLFIPNNFDGIHIKTANNIIGGTANGSANVVALNRLHGIEIDGPGATGNLIQGNVIGLNPDGGSDFGNVLDGIHITDAANNTIGGTSTGARNVISGNNNGIVIVNTGGNGPAAATGTLIQGNFIGTAADGTSDLGNSVDGIIIQAAPGNTVGGSASGAGNVIAGNNRGIRITDNGAFGNVIQGNFIGTDLTAAVATQNKIDGILITGGATNTTIGGIITGAGNTIAYNVGDAIRVESGVGNSILSNKVFSNARLGINLVGGAENPATGVTANSPGGPHVGANNLQNYPVITSAAPNQNATFVRGTFNSTPSTTFTVQFFSSPSQDTSGFGEGQALMGTTTLRTDAAGNATFAINIPVVIPVGTFVTATATDSSGNTSEFSNAVASVLTLIPSANPATIFVTTDLDVVDPNDGRLSLREAIMITDGTLQLSALSPQDQALVLGTPNGTAQDSILFQIPGAGRHTIFPTSPLPAITHSVAIDGMSQPGSAFGSPLFPDDDLQTVMIQIDGQGAGPGANGLTINAANCVVDGLMITNFDGNGVEISGANAQGNWLLANFIGTGDDPSTGRNFPLGMGNHGSGILITSSNNRIGGDTYTLRNVLFGNGVGLTISGPGGTGNLIQGNFILNNVAQGVLVASSNNTIGEAQAGGGNIISSNGGAGVEVTGGPGVQGNNIVGNEIGTEIGTGLRGLAPRPNNGEGVLVLNSPNNTIGSLIPAGKNVIAANNADGILITGTASTGNQILNNWIGFNIVKNVASLNIPNNFDGIHITSANNTVGGTTAGAANVIGINRRHGIDLDGPGATGNVVQGNIIGLNPGAGSDFGNTLNGIQITDAANNVIGGAVSGARNVISGNNNGIVIVNTGTNGPAAATGNIVLGNFIGTAGDGVSDLGNSVDGVVIDNAPRNTVGGTAAGSGNVISGDNRGVRISGAGAMGNLVQGNFIGTDLTGTAVIHNKIDGVLITNNASSNTVGGLAPGAGNTIAFNVGDGVRIESGVDNPVLSNRIFSNNRLGINLVGGTENAAGVTANTPGGPHAGPDHLQNFPVLTAVAPSGNATFVQGTLNGAPNTVFTIQFFSSAAQDPSGNGEGQGLIGSTQVTTNAQGNAAFALNVPIAVPSGQFVTATATDSSGNTSEFSNSLPSVPVSIQFSSAKYDVNEAAGTATITITRTGGTGGAVAVSFATSDGTATAGTDYTAVSGPVFFNAGETTKTVTIPISDDAFVEGNETINLVLTDPTNGATLGGPSAAVLTIGDDDQSTVQFSSAAYTVSENAGQVTITVVRTDTSGSLSVNYQTSTGTALAGVDYQNASGVLVFSPGQSSRTFSVPIVDDNQIGGAVTVNLALSSPTTGALGTPSTAVLTINDNDSAGTIQFATSGYSVVEGARRANITVTRSGGQGGTVSVFYRASGGTATAGADYSPVSGRLTFGPGETRKVISVPIVDDRRIEGNETVTLVLSNVQGGASLGTPRTATLTIRDNDGATSAPGQSPTPSASGPGPIVTDVQLIVGAGGVTGILVSFDKALNSQRATNLGSYGYFLPSTGPDGFFGTSDDRGISLKSAAYDPSRFQVLLTPRVALPFSTFGALTINGNVSNTAGITDTQGHLLDGDYDGTAGGMYRVFVGAGVRFLYNDRNGDIVSLSVAGGGLMELRRSANGEAQQLRLVQTVPGRTALYGHLKTPSLGDGRTTIPVLRGAAGVRIALNSSVILGRVSALRVPQGPHALSARKHA